MVSPAFFLTSTRRDAHRDAPHRPSPVHWLTTWHQRGATNWARPGRGDRTPRGGGAGGAGLGKLLRFPLENHGENGGIYAVKHEHGGISEETYKNMVVIFLGKQFKMCFFVLGKS